MEALFFWMLKAGFRGSLVILTVLILRLLLGKAPKSAVCGLWLLAFLSLLLPVEIHSPLSLQPPVPVVLEQAAAESSIPEPAAPEAPAAPHDREPAQKRESPRNPLPGIWLAGAGLLGLGGLLSYIRLRRRLCRAEPADGYWVCSGIDTAFVLGYWKPRIYVPQGISREDLPYILAHERMHLRKLDLWRKLLGYLALSIHWMNPLVWLSYVLFCRDTELACDEASTVNMDLEQRKAYARALVHCSTDRRSICPVAFGEGRVGRRIRGVLRTKKPSFWLTLAGTAAILCVALTLLTVPAEQIGPGDFISRDGRVEYSWKLREMPEISSAPVVQLRPKPYGEPEVRQAVTTFYGDSPLYALAGEAPRQLTRGEVQRRLDFLRPYEDLNRFRGLMALDDPQFQPDQVPVVLRKLEDQLIMAPEAIGEPRWDGSLQSPEAYPYLSLRAMGYIGEDPYELRVTEQNQEEPFYSLYLGLSDCGEQDLVSALGHAQRHAEAPMTKKMGQALSADAQELLDTLEPGAWKVQRVRLRRENQNSYSHVTDLGLGPSSACYINIDVAPVTAGVPVLDFTEGELWLWDRDQEAGYASGGSFTYTPDGRLTGLSLHNPAQVVKILEEKPDLLPPEQLMAAARDHLSQYGQEFYEAFSGGEPCGDQPLTFRVEIRQADFGLARIPGEPGSGQFYEVPALCFRGPILAWDPATGEDLGNQNYNQDTLVTVNALDGSIIG